MIDRVLNRYTLLIFLLFVLHIITVTIDGVFSSFDFIIVAFILTLNMADEENYLWMAVLFGFFSDFTRDGFYGPGTIIFLLFYLLRFRTDVIMDMTKVHYRILLFSGMSYVYCFYNLMITKYSVSSAVYISFVRTIINVVIILLIMTFFKGFSRAFKNA